MADNIYDALRESHATQRSLCRRPERAHPKTPPAALAGLVRKQRDMKQTEKKICNSGT